MFCIFEGFRDVSVLKMKAICCAFPISGEMIISNEKFNMTEELVSQYGVRMRLQIRNLSGRDFTGYRCISQNSVNGSDRMWINPMDILMI